MLVVGLLWAGAVWADDAPVPQTGQVLCYNSAGAVITCAGTRQDGALQKGVELPTPRFTVSRGTIKDKLTGLIWLKNANCPGTTRDWQTALNDVASLNSAGTLNGNTCGDTSGKGGTHRKDWRLPNIRELHSLVDYGVDTSPAFTDPVLPAGHPFTGFQASFYWSSTTFAGISDIAWGVFFNFGDVFVGGKNFGAFVTAVRGGS